MMTIHHLGKAILSLFACSLKNLFLMLCFCFLSFACFDDLNDIDSWLSSEPLVLDLLVEEVSNFNIAAQSLYSLYGVFNLNAHV